MTSPFSPSRRTAIAAALAASALFAGCAPVLVGGAMAGTALVATDRRSAGTQVDDSTNEVRALGIVDATIGDRGHVTATSYNRVLLLTGEVPTEADKAALGKAMAQIGTVRSTVNDLAVMPNSSLSSRSSDSVLTGQVKAAIFDTKELSVTTIKVVTERGSVYMMGLLTDGEAKRAIEVARVVGGVKKVVNVFQVITPAQLAAIQAANDAQPPAPAASAPPATPAPVKP